MKRVLMVILAALLAVSAGAALASGHHHGGHGYRAAAGRCYRTEDGYCHKDGACLHDGDACHFYADEDGDNAATAAARTGQAKTRICGHNYVDEDGACDRPARKWRALPATTAATADTNESAPRGAFRALTKPATAKIALIGKISGNFSIPGLRAFQRADSVTFQKVTPGSAFPGASKRGEG